MLKLDNVSPSPNSLSNIGDRHLPGNMDVLTPSPIPCIAPPQKKQQQKTPKNSPPFPSPPPSCELQDQMNGMLQRNSGQKSKSWKLSVKLLSRISR